MEDAEKEKRIKQVIEQVCGNLEMISINRGTPKNIRETASKSIEKLKSTLDLEELSIAAAMCVSKLEDISQDLNCPLHTRTNIFQILSLLEQLRGA